MVSKLECAIAWASKGYHIFPVEANGKKPLLKSWPSLASDDPAVVRAWWEQWPDANIGAHPAASGHIVIDVDDKGADGYAGLKALSNKHGDLPRTLRVITPTGGLHLWLTLEGSCANSASRLEPGIDTKGVNGYVLMPGSSINGAAYKGNGADPAPCPEAWAGALSVLNTREERKSATDTIDLPDAVEAARKHLRDLVTAGDVAVEGNGGNDRTYRLASSLRDFGLSEPAAVDLADAAWNPHCRPPWQRDELEHVFANAYQYAQNEAGAKAIPGGSVFASIAPPQEERTPKRSRFAPLTIADMQNMPDPEWLLDAWVPLYTTTLLYGKPGSMKSFAALDAALSVASGRCAWGLDYKARQLPVLYVAGEGQIGVGKQRVPAWLNARGVSENVPFKLITAMPRAGGNELEEMFEQIERTSGEALPRLVVIDTHARAMAGLDENSAMDTSKALDMYDAIAARYSCSVLAVHHSGKDGSSERGSTALGAGVDTVLRLDYDPSSGSSVLRCEKQKDGEAPKPITFEPVKSLSSIVLSAKNTPLVASIKAKSEMYYEVCEVLTRNDASNGGRAMTASMIAAQLPRVTCIGDTSEREAARRIAEATINRGRKGELSALVNGDGRFQSPKP